MFPPLQGNPRTNSLLVVAKINELDIELVPENPIQGVSAEYLKINPLGKIPTFQGSDGFTLSEAMAIAVYCELATYPLDVISRCL